VRAAAAPTVVIQPSKGWFRLDLAAIWHHRELLYFLVWRDMKVRYRQTLLGASWAILNPLCTVIVFTVVFGNFAKIPSDGLPYPVFAFTALLPWTYFAEALRRSGASLVGNAPLITKVYFPRLIIPIASTLTPAVDFWVSFLALLGLMAWFGIVPGWGVLALPVFMLLAALSALAVGLWLSPLNVRYRDVAYAIPFLSQLWMYASPVVYPLSLVPEQWRPVYSLNPMVGVVEGFRWALLGKTSPDFMAMTVSGTVVIVLLLGGIVYFNHMERTFADVV